MKSPRDRKRKLLSADFQAGRRTVYIYRDDGRGRPDGTGYIRKSDEKLTIADLKRELDPGLYLAIESGGDLPAATSRFTIPPRTEPESFPSSGMFNGDTGDLIKELRQVVLMRTLAKELHPEPPVLDLVKAIAEIFKTGNPGGRGDVKTFMDGYEFAGADTPETPADPLSSAMKALGLTTDAPRDEPTRKAIATLAHKLSYIDQHIKALETHLVEVRSALQSRLSPLSEKPPETASAPEPENTDGTPVP